MKLIGYCRVSTTMQEEEGISLDAQCEHIKKWCDISKTPHGTDYNLIDIVKEQGSAKSLKRPKLQAIREQCNEGVANGIIVVKLDRLTRSLRDITYLIENDFKKYDLISIGERLDTESAVGRLMLNMIVMVSQWEREAIGERTKTTLRYKKSKAEKTGGQVPYGYQEKIEESNGKSVKVLTINKSEFQMISLILDMWTSQSYSLNKISKVLLEKSYVNRNGNKFHPQQIKRIIEYHNNSQLTLNSSCGGKSWGEKNIMKITYSKFIKYDGGRIYKLAIEISDLKQHLENAKMARFERIESSFRYKTVSFSNEIDQMEKLIVSLKSRIRSMDCQFRSYYGCYLDDLVLTNDK